MNRTKIINRSAKRMLLNIKSPLTLYISFNSFFKSTVLVCYSTTSNFTSLLLVLLYYLHCFCYGFALNSDNGTCDSYMNTCHRVTLDLVT
jgi:hypothetical protein